MTNRVLFLLSGVGIVIGLLSAYVFAQQPAPQPPLFNPASNPYASGIYAEGIVESHQADGENINIYPEVSGPVTRMLVSEGEAVKVGTPLLTIDDSVQRQTTDQQEAQVDVTTAQIVNAKASLKSVADTLAKLEGAYKLDPQSVSRDLLDTERNTVNVAETNVNLTERQYTAQSKAFAAAAAVLRKYTIRAPVDGVVLSLQTSVGSYVSPQGAYGSYTEGYGPLITMGTQQGRLQVRAFVDEILVHRLPNPGRIKAQMFIRGTDIRIPLTFVRMQPFVSPKIELSDERAERVDVRVLPVIFRFDKPRNVNLYPGQLVDVYIGG